MKFLIDADIVAFKAAAACEQPINWGDGLWTLHSFEHEAIDHCMAYFDKVKTALGDGELVLYLTGPNNWRKEILPTYKSNRKDKRKPLLLMFLRNWMQAQFNAIIKDGFEADDLLGIAATSEDDCVIVSEDKDLNTIPCSIFNPAKDQSIRTISELEADYFHMMQTLTGDAVDGYSGLQGVGPKTAEKILAGCTTATEMWDAVVAAYANRKLSKEVALTQAQVARICRATEFNFNTGKVIPWMPNFQNR
jgi:5'-3' exonuclease